MQNQMQREVGGTVDIHILVHGAALEIEVVLGHADKSLLFKQVMEIIGMPSTSRLIRVSRYLSILPDQEAMNSKSVFS